MTPSPNRPIFSRWWRATLGSIHDRFITMSGREIALAIYVEHGNEPRAAYAMGALKRAMAWDEEAYGREYDLDIFMIVAVSAFNMGAMENKGLNIFNDKVLLASPETATDDDYARIESVVAHEYSTIGRRPHHLPRLVSAFAEGRPYRLSRPEFLRRHALSWRAAHPGCARAARPAIPGGRRSPRPSGAAAELYRDQHFYTATVYEKGSEVIGMLKTLVGPEGYRKATDLYFERHDGHAATVEDWVQCFEDSSGRDLAQFRLWYRQAGTPVIAADGLYDAGARSYSLTLSQTLGPTPGQPDKQPMHIPVRVGLVGQSGAPLPLTLEGENETGPESRVLELREGAQHFVFVDVAEEPLLSLGRAFRARSFQGAAQPQRTAPS